MKLYLTREKKHFVTQKYAWLFLKKKLGSPRKILGCKIQDVSASISIKSKVEEMSPDHDHESDKHLEERDRRLIMFSLKTILLNQSLYKCNSKSVRNRLEGWCSILFSAFDNSNVRKCNSPFEDLDFKVFCKMCFTQETCVFKFCSLKKLFFEEIVIHSQEFYIFDKRVAK